MLQSLTGKTALIVGVANKNSIGWGIARALSEAGAMLALTYRREGRLRHLEPLAAAIKAPLIAQCDVRDDQQIMQLMDKVRDTFGGLDILVHAAVGADPNDLRDSYLSTNRASFLDALDVSTYAFTALANAALPILRPNAVLLTLSYHGARQVVQNYNVMGVAKAALEASVRYMANDLGPQGIRVNTISAGPIRTLSASGIAGFRARHAAFANRTALKRNVTIDDVGASAIWLCSDAGAAITGETIYVDAGLHHYAAIPNG